jgi:signal transduction histidine kinase
LRFEVERQKISLSVEVSEALPLLSADPDQLQQVLVNLVKNACDACSTGGHVTIRAHSEERGPSVWNRVRVEVEDDGCGIMPADQLRIFDPFYTTKKRGQGTGLGLTVAAQIVRNHGGEITVDSNRERGARLAVLWPIAEVQEEQRGNLG